MQVFFARSKTPCASRCRLFAVTLITLIVCGQALSQTTLKAHSNLLNAEAPISFPETLVVGPQGDVYVLDTNLSTLFALETQTGKLKRICGAEKLASPADIAVDRKGNLWVLSMLHSKIFKLNSQCDVQTEIVSRQLPLKIATNSFGEVVVLTGNGNNLFEIYGPDGKFLRAFGQRLDYKDSELSDGRIASDRAGGFFYSFNYPPLIRHYGRQGKLISEFKPESDVEIAPASISVRKRGNSMVVNSSYQILVLDMTVDSQGRLYLLLSGKHKVPALSEGTRKLAVVAGSGRVLKTVHLEYNFHRLVSGNRRLYLLRNRKPLRLDAYAAL
jgi:DNA-binding beta-propeller fold protein YncE